MSIEETTQKTMSTNEEETSNKNKNINPELEKGEITNDVEINQTTIDDENENENENSHPLENSWTFSFDNPSAKSKRATWGSSIRQMYTFSTIQQFWSLYNNIHHPSKLVVGADFYCFKHKIEPKWEDPSCANGGKWTATYSKGKSDSSWLNTLLAMIGEQFDHGDAICGAVVNVRSRQDKISIWTKDAANEAAQLSIGHQWKKFLDYSETISFIFHDDAKKLGRGAKNKYTC